MTDIFRRLCYVVTFCCLLLPVLARGQALVVPGVSPTGTQLPATATGAGTAVPGFPTPSSTDAHLLPITVTSVHTRFDLDHGLYKFYDNVKLESSYANIDADEMTYDEHKRRVVALGHVTITTLPDQNTFHGSLLEYDVLPPNHWRFVDVAVTFPAAFLGPPFIAPLFISGATLSGLTGKPIRVDHGHFTTCDDPKPHYELISKSIDIYPGDKIIARHNVLVVLGHRVLYLPYLFLSLRQFRSPIVPEYGVNDVEGYYARFLYQYVFSPTELGGVRLDLTTKRGVGLAVDHFYTVSQGGGELFLYGRQNLHEYAFRLDHSHQTLPGQLQANAVIDLRQDYSVTADQSTTNKQYTTSLMRNTEHTRMAFNFNRLLNEGQFGSNSTNSLLSYSSSVFAGRLESSLRFDSFGSTGSIEGTSTPAPEIWSHLLWAHPSSFATFYFQLDKRNSLGSSSSTTNTLFSGIERLPEVYFEAKAGTDKLDNIHLSFLRQVPSTFRLGWGIFSESSSGSVRTFDRIRLEWETNQLLFTHGGNQLAGSAYFYQTIYGDPDTTALFKYGVHLSDTTKITHHLTNTLRFDRDFNNGYTPFSFDTVSKLETLTDNVRLLRGRLDVTIACGRDMVYNQWQNLTLTSVVPIGQTAESSQQFSYDLNAHQWGDVVSQYSWFPGPRVTCNLGTRFGLQPRQLKQIATQVNWVVTPQWHIQWHGGYDGIYHQINYDEFLLTRDLHCWDATIMYSQSQKYVGFYMRLKAFNTPLPNFGIGRGGQALNTDLGSAM